MEPARETEIERDNGARESQRRRENQASESERERENEAMRTREGERESSPREREKEREIKRMEPELYNAAKSGDFDCLTKIPGYLGILHQTTPMGNNILHVAAQHEQVDFIEQLLDKCQQSGQSLLVQGNHRGDTPLHIAAKVGSYSICEVFIDFAGNKVSDVEGGLVDQRKELLRMVNVDKDTILHYAVRYQHSLVVELLIQKDLELCNIANYAHESPLYLATSLGSSKITKNILDASSQSFSHEGPGRMTALHAAIYYKSHAYDLAEVLVKSRREMITEGDNIGWTPLHYAACYDKAELVRLFLQHNVSAAYLLDDNGESALHIAAFLGHIAVIDELLKSSPDICELINKKGQTALHVAVIGGRLNAVKFISNVPSFKHFINEQDNDGNTAVHLAALHRRHNIAKFLARYGRANITLSNKKHMTALGIFDRHREVVLKAPSPHRALKMFFGVQYMQDQAIERVKEKLEKQHTKSQSATSATTFSNEMNNKEKVDPSKQSAFEISQIAAVLIATVTFTAAFTVPGGFKSDEPNQGMANFAGKAAFKAFVVSNTIAFYSSLVAVYFQFKMSFETSRMRFNYAYLTWVYTFSIRVAILGMVVAFAYGTCAVLPKTAGLAVFAYTSSACLLATVLMGTVPASLVRYLGYEKMSTQVWRSPDKNYGVKSLY